MEEHGDNSEATKMPEAHSVYMLHLSIRKNPSPPHAKALSKHLFEKLTMRNSSSISYNTTEASSGLSRQVVTYVQTNALGGPGYKASRWVHAD